MTTKNASSAARYLPEGVENLSLKEIRRRAEHCRACPLYKRNTHTVFGEGPAGAKIILIGEQPGDQEDRAARPFVGPAGHLLDRALIDAGIERSSVYVTNAVKHFKWVPSGKRRLHQKPSAREVAACRPWLEAEIAVLAPRVVVALGATAAQALQGPGFRVMQSRGKPVKVAWAGIFFATVHPSSILRGPPADRERAYKAFCGDLKKVKAWLEANEG